ncbi:hypothetical protein BDV12DRAFT_208904 [Aspergillus spectabilis]
MIYSTILAHGLFLGLANSAVIRRWTNSGSATGTTYPDVASRCMYWANNIFSGNSCDSVQSYFGITIDQLVSWNPSLSSTDCSLTVGWSYYVDAPTVTTTKTSTSKTTATTTTTKTTAMTTTTTTTTTTSGAAPGLIQTGDGCYDLAATFNILLSDFYAWNPAVGTSCESLQAGYYVCIGVAGGSSTTTTTSATSVPSTTTMTTATVTGPTPQQTGIISICNDYHLNPAVGSSCSALWLGYYICVGIQGGSQPTTTTTTTTTTATGTGPTPTQSGIISSCTDYIQASAGDTCSTLLTGYYSYLPVSLFTEWNPAVGSSCSNLLAGYYYCVATTDIGLQPGTISTCKKYHRVVSGDSCWSIEQEAGITAAQFNRWNSGVGEDCASLWAGYYVCIGV